MVRITLGTLVYARIALCGARRLLYLASTRCGLCGCRYLPADRLWLQLKHVRIGLPNVIETLNPEVISGWCGCQVVAPTTATCHRCHMIVMLRDEDLIDCRRGVILRLRVTNAVDAMWSMERGHILEVRGRMALSVHAEERVICQRWGLLLIWGLPYHIVIP